MLCLHPHSHSILQSLPSGTLKNPLCTTIGYMAIFNYLAGVSQCRSTCAADSTILTSGYQYSRLGSIVSFVVVLKLQGRRFDPGLANFVYRTMLIE